MRRLRLCNTTPQIPVAAALGGAAHTKGTKLPLDLPVSNYVNYLPATGGKKYCESSAGKNWMTWVCDLRKEHPENVQQVRKGPLLLPPTQLQPHATFPTVTFVQHTFFHGFLPLGHTQSPRGAFLLSDLYGGSAVGHVTAHTPYGLMRRASEQNLSHSLHGHHSERGLF